MLLINLLVPIITLINDKIIDYGKEKYLEGQQAGVVDTTVLLLYKYDPEKANNFVKQYNIIYNKEIDRWERP